MRLYAQAPIETAPLRADDIDPPEPASDEILVRVMVCAVCRTDLHVIEGDLAPRRMPIVPGHQIVGRVHRAGRAATRFAAGDRVGIAWLRQTCGRCPFCRSGRENLCERAEFTGWTADGGYAEYAVVPEAFAYRLPAGFTDEAAAPLLCAGIIGYRALRLSGVPDGGRLGLYGFGSSAHVTLQVARGRGMEVYVATREPWRRRFALDLGAAWAGDVAQAMPRRADGAIVFAPSGAVVPLALGNVERGGVVALAGIHMSPVPSLPYSLLFEERAVRSVTANTRADGEGLLAEASRIAVRPVVTPFPLGEANRALADLKRGSLEGTGLLVAAV
jgi:alcohol dehydrogenase, propanol-preferring